MNTLQGASAANGQPVDASLRGLTTNRQTVPAEVAIAKRMRLDIDEIARIVKAAPPTRERSLAITKFREAIMWFSMDLERIGEANPGLVANPYPNSKGPSITVFDRTADGIKM